LICFLCTEFPLNLRQRKFHFQMDTLLQCKMGRRKKNTVGMSQLKPGQKFYK
jgi:hypothetical protein